MPSQPTFGRRTVAVPEETPRNGAPDGVAGLIGSTRERLSDMTRQLWLLGDLIGFAGVALIVLASVLAAASTSATQIDGVVVPAGWARTLTDIPHAVERTQFLMPSLFTGAWLLVFGVGAIAVFRGRWLLVGMSLAALLFPWPWFGFAMKLGPTFAGLLLLMAFIRLWRPGKVLLAVFIVGFFVAAPYLATQFSRVVEALYLPHGYPTARYTVLADAAQTRQDLDRLLVSLGKVPTASPADAWLRTFALAQTQTLLGDARAVQSSLHALAASSLVPGMFETHRLEVLSNFVASAGLDGQQARAELQQRALGEQLVNWLVNGLGILLMAVGLFFDYFGRWLVRRNVRIADLQHRLHFERARPRHTLNPDA